MPFIPQEILDIIIGYAAADGRHFSCAFVSHIFHQVVLPYKFKSLTFWNRSRANYYRTDGIPIPKFCEAINAEDEHALSLAPLVRELSLLTWSSGYRWDLKEPLEKIINSALSFRNLTKFSMDRCVASTTIMEELGKLVQLQSLHILVCQDESYDEDIVSFSALSNLQSLHTLESKRNWIYVRRHLACIPMKNLRILKSSDLEVIKALLTTDPPIQLKELWLNLCLTDSGDYSMLWNYLARVTSLTHLSLPLLRRTPSHIFHFPELQYLHVHAELAPSFADQPMKEMKIHTEREPGTFEALLPLLQRLWKGIVFPHVEYLETDQWAHELINIPIDVWREFLSNVKEVRWPSMAI